MSPGLLGRPEGGLGGPWAPRTLHFGPLGFCRPSESILQFLASVLGALRGPLCGSKPHKTNCFSILFGPPRAQKGPPPGRVPAPRPPPGPPRDPKSLCARAPGASQGGPGRPKTPLVERMGPPIQVSHLNTMFCHTSPAKRTPFCQTLLLPRREANFLG